MVVVKCSMRVLRRWSPRGLVQGDYRRGCSHAGLQVGRHIPRAPREAERPRSNLNRDSRGITQPMNAEQFAYRVTGWVSLVASARGVVRPPGSLSWLALRVLSLAPSGWWVGGEGRLPSRCCPERVASRSLPRPVAPKPSGEVLRPRGEGRVSPAGFASRRGLEHVPVGARYCVRTF